MNVEIGDVPDSHQVGGNDVLEVRLRSGKSVALRELTWLESRKLDRLAGDCASDAGHFRVAASIKTVNGQLIGPGTNVAELDMRMSQFTASEGLELLEAYAKNFFPDSMSGNDLKNASTPAASQPS